MDVLIEGGNGMACLGITYKVARGRCKGVRRILGEQRRLDSAVSVDTQAGVVGTKDVVYDLRVFYGSDRFDEVGHSDC